MTMHASPRFTYPEDEQFFRALLCGDGENLDRYMPLFDFRSPTVKRQVVKTVKLSEPFLFKGKLPWRFVCIGMQLFG
jgi:hypothetical protein